MAKIYAFCNHKGGVGKTTSVINLGVGFSRRKQKTLLIDLDPQSNLSQSLGLEEKTGNNIYGGLKGDYVPEPFVINKNLHAIPAVLDLSGAELELAAVPARELLLKEIVEQVKNPYDIILIDCPPSLGLLTMNALAAADEVFIPVQSEYLAVHGLKKIMETIDIVHKRLNNRLTLGGLFLTQYDKRKVLNRDIRETVGEAFGQKVFDTVIRNNIALAEAPVEQMDIYRYKKDSAGARDYAALTREILQKNLA
ncbi:MAG TPA: ParA family protein [Salinivirga sp.]|uniref:ParA family protein n=1 Tax=Salinivirga sp. TaxID=1970192 RepID=UPI002B4847CA|nr:ParA family protein [Salinivirga sp.]HKK59129.1 ParA family protein [Salinivirga sp.]